MPPFGRGGAGNIKAITNETAKLAADIEANRPSTSSSDTAAMNAHLASESDHLHRHITPRQYANIGRGGAGNLVDAKGLEQAPGISDGEAGTKGAGEGRGYGRGGAGNQEFGTGVREGLRVERERREMEEGEMVRREVERGVGARLAVPEKARTAGGGER